MNAELESERNLGIQDKILKHLETPSSIDSLYTPFFDKHGITKNELLSNLNYLICYRRSVVSFKGLLYLKEKAPKKWVRRKESQTE